MIKKVLGTISTRIICVIISFALMIINSRSFGPQGVGSIGLFVLGISILQILTSLLGSSSLVYMLPKYNPFQIVFIAHLSSLCINIIGGIIMLACGLVPMEYAFWFIIATICVSVLSTNSSILLSKEKIAWFNVSALLQMILLIVFTLFLIVYSQQLKELSYIIAYTVSYFIVALLTIFPSLKGMVYSGWNGIKKLIVNLAKYGIIIQITNLAQMLNYRLNYYIIEFCAGRAPLGIFDNSTKVAESIWILPKSLSSLEYAIVANRNEEQDYIKRITLSFVKLSLICSFISIIIILCLPPSVFTFILGPGFEEIKPVLCFLAPGVFLFSSNIIISHYFSGLGKFSVNCIASFIGLGITAILGLSLIPWFKTMPYMHTLMLMSVITSIAYACSFGYTLIQFCLHAQVKLAHFIVNKQDIQLLKQAIKYRLRHDQ